MYDGFKQRAHDVAQLLQSKSTSFIVVTSPSEDSVAEATFFAARLNQSRLPFGALVVNRVHPRWGEAIATKPRQFSKLEAGSDQARLLVKLLRNEAEFSAVVALEEKNLDTLARRIPRHRWVRVPYLEQEAVDFPGLVAITEQLLGR
jgi:anion-transporting  ArsA/GET3 family ATPase